MRNIALVAPLLVALFGADAATACGIVSLGTLRDAIPTSDAIFVFRVDSLARVQKHENDWPSFTGRIHIVESLHGPKPKFTKVFVDGICNGIRLRVDSIYLAATDQSGKTLVIKAGDTSLANVTSEYYFGHPFPDIPSPTIDAVRGHFRGIKLPADFPRREVTDSLRN